MCGVYFYFCTACGRGGWLLYFCRCPTPPSKIYACYICCLEDKSLSRLVGMFPLIIVRSVGCEALAFWAALRPVRPPCPWSGGMIHDACSIVLLFSSYYVVLLCNT